MSKLKPGTGTKNKYTRYKSRAIKNRELKLSRLIKEQPNNAQLQQAMKSLSYRRKKPAKKNGWIAPKEKISINRFMAQQQKQNKGLMKALVYNPTIVNVKGSYKTSLQIAFENVGVKRGSDIL